RTSAGHGETRPDRRIDALDVGGLTEMVGGPDKIGPGGADRRAGADPADVQPKVGPLEAEDSAADRGAEDEAGADDPDRDRSGCRLGGREQSAGGERGPGKNERPTSDDVHVGPPLRQKAEATRSVRPAPLFRPLGRGLTSLRPECARFWP